MFTAALPPYDKRIRELAEVIAPGERLIGLTDLGTCLDPAQERRIGNPVFDQAAFRGVNFPTRPMRILRPGSQSFCGMFTTFFLP